MTSLIGAGKDAPGVVVELVVVFDQGADDRDDQAVFNPPADRVEIAQAVEHEILSIDRVAMLAVALEHVVEDEFAQELGLLATAQIDRLDFPVDVAFFVG